MMQNPWILLVAGILLCGAGVYLFYQNAFEEGKSVFRSILLMIGGVILIGIGTAKYLRVIE